METLTEEEKQVLANLPGPVEIKIAIEYLARESRKLDMEFVADLLKSASMAINEHLSLPCEADISDNMTDETRVSDSFPEADIFGRVSVSQLEYMLGLEMDDD